MTTTLIIVAISTLIGVTVYYGLKDSSSARGQKRRARQRKDGRRRAEQSRSVDAANRAESEKESSVPDNDAVTNWASPEGESDP